jgi:hypothetical protein
MTVRAAIPGGAETPRQMHDRLVAARWRDEVQIARQYVLRDIFIDALKARGAVTLDDLAALCRLGRCRVASELWAACGEDVRAALLADEHHWVRSCARLAALGVQ